LDRELETAKPRMRGRVLDVGGRKGKFRGSFRPPTAGVERWEYLNADPATEPDYVGSVEAIPLADATVDTVVMTEVLEYVRDCPRALHEIKRILKPGGVCFMSTPMVMAIHGDRDWDRQRLTEVRLRELAVEAGFPKAEIREMGALGSVIYDLLHAATGYAAGGAGGPGIRMARLLLPRTAWAFAWLDRGFKRSAAYITTGYFTILEKDPRA
jgi:SAM-dependent methyltransferase